MPSLGTVSRGRSLQFSIDHPAPAGPNVNIQKPWAEFKENFAKRGRRPIRTLLVGDESAAEYYGNDHPSPTASDSLLAIPITFLQRIRSIWHAAQNTMGMTIHPPPPPTASLRFPSLFSNEFGPSGIPPRILWE
ncbi:hypothetical protein BJ138DRAFT_1117927 [Hygrophoropsis aurantiaca]|uniref:Uncharacterized protein n=1 Tax=Hygrophoropsis aurantiaca TaxID=72124 RepID=A0ACB7ZYN2_9AGAM|nr:hypothetical protein BJ138DRAFT_1117927 [Hygrophoropsis aurantiaca]